MLWPFSMLPGSYICMDTETTGLPKGQAMPDIVSLGLTEVHGRKIASTQEFKIRPDQTISEEAERVHGIGSEEARHFDELEDHWQNINEMLSRRVVVIHHAGFDWPILLNQLGRTGLSLPIVEGVFCSQKSAFPWATANKLECTSRGPSLDVLTAALELEDLRSREGGLHGAAIDSRQTALVVEKLRGHFGV